MLFKEAYQHLTEGKKLTRREWNNNFYITMIDHEIISNRIDWSYFDLTSQSLTKKEWVIKNNDNKEPQSIIELVEELQRGKEAYNINDEDEIIKYDHNSKQLITKTIYKINILLTFECLTVNDWELFND